MVFRHYLFMEAICFFSGTIEFTNPCVEPVRIFYLVSARNLRNRRNKSMVWIVNIH